MLVKVESKGKEEILVVSSRQIAEDFEKRHADVLEGIRGLKEQIQPTEKSVGYFIPSEYRDAKGEMRKEYLLTRDGFSLLVMGFTGEKALSWKLKYIDAFNEMEKELARLYEERKRWEIERAKGVLVRHILTDTIKMKVAETQNKKFAYPNYTKLIYRAIFGKGYPELLKEFGVKPKESLRDYLTSEQLREVEQMEMLVSSLIGVGMGYTEIKEFIAQRYTPCMLLAG